MRRRLQHDRDAPTGSHRSRLAAATAALLLVACALLTASLVSRPAVAIAGERAPYDVAPTPGWVLPLALDAVDAASAESVVNGAAYLLYDHQLDARSHRPRSRYTRIVKAYTDQIGLRDGARIEIAFDPDFERVVLHSLAIRRGTMVHDRLRDARAELLVASPGTADAVLDGTRTLLIEIDDLRIGDVVDYSYTVVGSNPVFGDHVLEELRVGWDVPVSRFRHRILAARDAALAYRAHATSIAPRVVDAADHRELVWEQTAVPAYVPEDRLPEWYRPYPYVEVGDFGDWPAVAAWAGALFPDRGRPTPQLAARARELTRDCTTQVEKVAALLRFTQEEIRYVAIEIGSASHVPAPPDQVLRRRYGDCKDKSLALTALLTAVGVRADVALVSGRGGLSVADRLPTPLPFDHAVVRVRYDEGDQSGRVVWLDPTLLHQAGAAAALASRARGFALRLVTDGTGDAGLERIVDPSSPPPSSEIEVRLDLGRLQRPTRMTVDTLLRGQAADETRRELKSNTPASTERAYRDFYGGLYPQLRSAEPLRIQDDELSGELRMRESYELTSFWRADESSGGYLGEIFPLELARDLDPPRVRVRTMPIAVAYPHDRRYTIRAEIDMGWDVRPERVVVEDPAFYFERDVSVDGDALVIRYTYRSRIDYVPAAAAAAHIANLDRARRLLSYVVARPADTASAASIRGPSALNWPKVFAASTFVTFTFAIIAFALSLHLKPRFDSTGALYTIGGWLHVALFVLIAATLSVVYDLLVNLLPVLNGEDWERLTSAASATYHPFWAPYLLYAAMARALIFAALVGVIVLFLLRSRRVPALLAATAVLLVLVAAVEADCLTSVEPRVLVEAGVRTSRRAYGNLAAAGAICLLALPYVLRSRRVRRTFVR